jgi:hypothetical protein
MTQDSCSRCREWQRGSLGFERTIAHDSKRQGMSISRGFVADMIPMRVGSLI